METTIRIVVANQSRLMRELVLEIIADQPDMEIVGEIGNNSDIPLVVERTRPNFLIIDLDEADQRHALWNSLLKQFPNMKILALSLEPNSNILFWASVDIHSKPIETLEEGVLNAQWSKVQLASRSQ